MSTVTQFFGGEVTTSIVNSHSSGSASSPNVAAVTGQGTREVLSGALTAATLATVLTITGSGRIPVLSAYAKNGTSRTIRLVIEIDGVSAFDATSAAVALAGSGLFAAGLDISGQLAPSQPIVFASSLVVKVASSLTETNNVAIAYLVFRT